MINYNLHFIRSGLTEADEKHLLSGASDSELDIKGICGLITLREQYEYPAVGMVYCSPLNRCIQTTGIIYPGRGIIAVEGLVERRLGRFEGRSMEELADDGEYRTWLADSSGAAPGGGESMQDFCRRALASTAAVIEDMMRSEMTDAAIVTDGGVIMTVLSALGLPRRPMEGWMSGPGRGYTCFVNPQLWHRDRVFEVAGIMPHGLDRAI